MGTNYYLRKKSTNKGPDDIQDLMRILDIGEATAESLIDAFCKDRHIGKSSAGWCFSLHVYPDEGINTLDDWKKLFNDPEYTIFDEYGEEKTTEEMLDSITNRAWRERSPSDYNNAFYRSYAEFLEKNCAEEGPRNLLRHVISESSHCVGHGEGTYDYIVITRALTGMLSDKQEAEAVALANVMAEANVRNLEEKTEVASGTRDRIRDLPK